jgi:hypothetical protein
MLSALALAQRSGRARSEQPHRLRHHPPSLRKQAKPVRSALVSGQLVILVTPVG